MKDLNTFISEHPFLRGMKPEYITIVAQGAVEETYQAGETIFRERDYANHFYLIQEGAVAIEAKADSGPAIRLDTVRPGDVLGWSWLFPPFTWHFGARAVEPARLVALDGAHLLVACESDHQFGFDLMKRISGVVIHRLQTARKLLVRREEHRLFAASL